MKWARESVRVGRDREREEGESGAKERVIVGQERVKMGHGSGERDRERVGRKRESALRRKRVCCKGTGRVGRERKRESGEYVRRVRERVCLEMQEEK